MNSPRGWLPRLWFLICLLLLGPLVPFHAASPEATLDLGAVWDESENGWTGVWTRRPGTNIFDAVWTKDGGRVTAVLTMTPIGTNTVAIDRKDTSDSEEVDYIAALGADGSVAGNGRVRSSAVEYTWHGRIRPTLPGR